MAPRLADHLSHHVGLFDAMLAPDLLRGGGATCTSLSNEFTGAMERGDDLQDALDAARRWAQAREFQIGMQILLGHERR